MHFWDAAPCSVDSVPSSPIEALKLAVHKKEVSLPESLVTIIQLMVNMTSANALGNMVMRLTMEAKPSPDDDASLDSFVTEVLRVDAPLQRNPRRVLQPIEIGGTKLSPGAQVLLFIGAANMDPKVFSEPASFVGARTQQSLTFGVGPHYCLGSYLVK